MNYDNYTNYGGRPNISPQQAAPSMFHNAPSIPQGQRIQMPSNNETLQPAPVRSGSTKNLNKPFQSYTLESMKQKNKSPVVIV